VNLDLLTRAQKHGRNGVLAQAVAGYIKWMAPRYERLRAETPQRIHSLRQAASGQSLHPRLPTTLAELAVGWGTFLDYAVDVGAIDRAERVSLETRVWAGLKAATDAQILLQTESDPVPRYLDLLRSVVTSGSGHIATISGEQPHNPAGFGWRSEEYYTGPEGGVSERWRPQGTCIGWIDETDLYLDPRASFACAQRLAAATDDPLAITLSVLQQRLREHRLLVTTDPDHLTVRKTIAGNRCRVLHVHSAAVLEDKGVHAIDYGSDHASIATSVDRSSGPVAAGSETKQCTKSVHKQSRSLVISPNGHGDGPIGPIGPLLRSQDPLSAERAHTTSPSPCNACDGTVDHANPDGVSTCSRCHPPDARRVHTASGS
jgi:hypothetical protein